MSAGIPRAPIYPRFPSGDLTNAQASSLSAYENLREFSGAAERMFDPDQGDPIRLTEVDFASRRSQQDCGRQVCYSDSRTAAQLGASVLARPQQMVEEFRGKSLLEIGCGIGRFGAEMHKEAKAEVTFIDRDPEVLDKIASGVGRVVLGDGMNLAFEDESFDRVTAAFSSVHWAATPTESVMALNEAIRVTEVGGSTIIIPAVVMVEALKGILPELSREMTQGGAIQGIDRYLAVIAAQNMAVIKSLFRLAEQGYTETTWVRQDETIAPGAILDRYSVVVDKRQSIPAEVLATNFKEALELTAAAE